MDRLKQEKFLDLEFTSNKLKAFKEISSGDIGVKVRHSDNAESNSIYVDFYKRNSKGQWFKQTGLRISDHIISSRPQYTQFIIQPSEIINKKKKLMFVRCVNNCIKKTKLKTTYEELDRLEKLSKTVD